MLTLPGCSLALDAEQPSGTPDLENTAPYFYEYGPLTIAIDESIQFDGPGRSELRSQWVLKNTGSNQVELSMTEDPELSYFQPTDPVAGSTLPVKSFGIASCGQRRHSSYCSNKTIIAPGQKLTFMVRTRRTHVMDDSEAVTVRLRLNVHIDGRRGFRRSHLDLEIPDVGVKDEPWEDARRPEPRAGMMEPG